LGGAPVADFRRDRAGVGPNERALGDVQAKVACGTFVLEPGKRICNISERANQREVINYSDTSSFRAQRALVDELNGESIEEGSKRIALANTFGAGQSGSHVAERVEDEKRT